MDNFQLNSLRSDDSCTNFIRLAGRARRKAGGMKGPGAEIEEAPNLYKPGRQTKGFFSVKKNNDFFFLCDTNIHFQNSMWLRLSNQKEVANC